MLSVSGLKSLTLPNINLNVFAISAPFCLTTWSGTMTFPNDLLIFLPSPSITKPWDNKNLYGAWPLVATEVVIDELNQPRYWSLPSKYKSAGKLNSGRVSRTPLWDEPESNHTSMMSFSFVNSPFGLPGCVKPSGNKSLASFSNQILEPCCSNKSATWFTVSFVMMMSPFSA